MMRTKKITPQTRPGITPPERLMMICFGLALAVLLLTGGFVLNMALPLFSSSPVDHTHEVMTEIYQLRTRVDSAENSQRGYFLTSEKRFLAQRDSAAAAIKASFAKLQTLTAGHPSQQERISRLQAAVDQRIRFLIASSAVFDAQGFNATQPLFKAGHEVMMTVRTIMQEAEQAEQALLVQRKDGALSRIKVILAGIIALLAFVPLLRLVELMGGVIGIDSSVDVGGVFWFELPAASAPRPAAGAADGHGSTGGTDQPEQGVALASGPKRTLLYVEDNPANLELVEQLIVRRSELKLLTAIDGHLGLAVARLQRPDVILLDINLPGIGGFDLLKMLQEDPATAHIPVLALSANAVPRDIAKGLEAGFFRYLTKPIKIGEFMDALDLALEHAAEDQVASTQ